MFFRVIHKTGRQHWEPLGPTNYVDTTGIDGPTSQDIAEANMMAQRLRNHSTDNIAMIHADSDTGINAKILQINSGQSLSGFPVVAALVVLQNIVSIHFLELGLGGDHDVLYTGPTLKGINNTQRLVREMTKWREAEIDAR